MKINKLITLIFSLILFCNLVVAEQSSIEKTADLTQTEEQSLSPKDFMTDPDKLLMVWGDEPIPLSSYADEEKQLQQYINEKTATAVATYSPKSQEKEWTKYDHEEITPYTWKVLDLRLTESNGKTFDISLLRPHWWMRNIGADKVGNRFYLKIPDVEEGWAVVKAIRINQLDTRLWDEARNGDFVYRPVTGTFKHESNNVLQLYFGDNQKPLGVTFTHPIYSADRKAYVSAGKLKIGEKVKTRQGLTTLTEKKQLAGTHPVYNLEIYRDHNYMVSMDSILVHNDSPAYSKVGGSGGQRTPSVADKTRALVNEDRAAAWSNKATKQLINTIKEFPSKSQAEKTATMIGAYDIKNGKIAIGRSNGKITAESLHPDTIKYVENKLGVKIGEFTSFCTNKAGACAEVSAADQLVRQGVNPADIKFTQAVRPKKVFDKGQIPTTKKEGLIDTCENCQTIWPKGD